MPHAVHHFFTFAHFPSALNACPAFLHMDILTPLLELSSGIIISRKPMLNLQTGLVSLSLYSLSTLSLPWYSEYTFSSAYTLLYPHYVYMLFFSSKY